MRDIMESFSITFDKSKYGKTPIMLDDSEVEAIRRCAKWGDDLPSEVVRSIASELGWDGRFAF